MNLALDYCRESTATSEHKELLNWSIKSIKSIRALECRIDEEGREVSSLGAVHSK